MRHTPPEPSAASTHEHEWHPIEDLYPVFEDFAAIFHEKCEWEEIIDSHRSKRHDEIFYEIGASCEETRLFRFDIDKIEDLQTGEVVEEDEIWEGEPTPQAEEWMGELERDDIRLISRWLELCVEDVVSVGVNRHVQPVPASVEANHGFVDRYLIRSHVVVGL